MNDGHCEVCGKLMTYVGGGLVQEWQCQNKVCEVFQRVVFRCYNKREIYQTYKEAEASLSK